MFKLSASWRDCDIWRNCWTRHLAQMESSFEEMRGTRIARVGSVQAEAVFCTAENIGRMVV